MHLPIETMYVKSAGALSAEHSPGGRFRSKNQPKKTTGTRSPSPLTALRAGKTIDYIAPTAHKGGSMAGFPQRKCVNCNALYGDIADYCGRCGTKLPPPLSFIDEEEKRSHFAIVCGDGKNHHVLANPFGTEYCIACGKKISATTIH